MAASKYKPVYAPLLIYHMSQGRSFGSFAGLCVSKQELLNQNPQSTWVKGYKDFRKEPVSHKTLYNWLEEYPAFQEAYETGLSCALYYLENLLLHAAQGTKPAHLAHSKRLDANTLMFLLRTRFSDIYTEYQAITHAGKLELDAQLDITGIDDPGELLELVEEGLEQMRSKVGKPKLVCAGQSCRKGVSRDAQRRSSDTGPTRCPSAEPVGEMGETGSRSVAEGPDSAGPLGLAGH